MVGFRFDRAVFHDKGVVIFAAAQRGGSKTAAKLNALDCRNGEGGGCDPVFHTVKHRIAQSRRQAKHRAFDHTADGISLRPGICDLGAHGFSAPVVHRRKGLVRSRSLQLAGIVHAADGGNARDHPDPLGGKQLQTDAARHAKGRRHASGEMPAAGAVLRAAVFDLRGIIRMSRAGHRRECGIVRGTGIGIADDRRKRCAAGDPVDETGEEFALIRLLARRCVIALSGSAAAEKALKRFKIDPLSGRDPLKRHADRRGMGLTEYRQADILAIAAAHNQSPFSC